MKPLTAPTPALGHELGDHIEYELKFCYSAQHGPAPALAQQSWIQALKPQSLGASDRILITYFDTTDWQLLRLGMGLRRSQHTDGRCLITLKRQLQAHQSLQMHAEWQAVCPADHANPWQFLPESARRLLPQGLQAQLQQDMAREQCLVHEGDTQVLVSLDHVQSQRLPHPSAVHVWQELELEWQHGPMLGLWQCAHVLLTDQPVRLHHQSKPMVALAALDPAWRPQPQKMRRQPAPEESSAVTLCLVLFDQALSHYLHHQQCYIQAFERETALHEMRLAMRRLRILLGLMKEDSASQRQLRRQLRAWDQAMGQARDWDVLLHETLAEIVETEPEAVDWAKVIEPLDNARQQGHMHLLRWLHEPAQQHSLVQLLAWRQQGPNTRRPQALEKRLQRRLARKAKKWQQALAHVEQQDETSQHRQRRHTRQLRYLLDMFGPHWLPEQRPHLAGELAVLQEILGQLHDLATMRQLLRQISSPALQQALPVIQRWMQHNEQRWQAQLGPACKRLRKQHKHGAPRA